MAPNGAAAIFISSGGTTGNLYFVHTDYLGSIVALSNQTVYLAEQYAYDAWGNRRTPSDWSLADNRTDLLIDRGYTMHEHITGFGLVNMSRPEGEHEQVLRVTFGRVYDPKLGRFLSPDPVLQDASNTQNMNRYSYVWNNPLKYVDPSGYYNQAAVASDNGGEEGGGSSGSTNWYGTVGSSGRMGWNLGTIYNSSGSINYTGGLFGQAHTNINGTWVSSGDVKRYSGSSAGQAFSLIRSAHQYGRALSATMAQFRMSASFDNGSVYTITAGNGMYTISNLDVSVLGAAQSKGDSWVLGPVGIGVTFELAIPAITIGKRKFFGFGFGYSCGFVADNKGLGWYSTDKVGDGKGIAFSLAPEVFYVHGTRVKNPDIFALDGNGYSTSVGLGVYGYEFSVDGSAGINKSSNYYQFSISGAAKGIDIGYVNWTTVTHVTPLDY